MGKYWTQESPGITRSTGADTFLGECRQVLQQIIRQDACQNASISSSSSPLHPPSLLHDEPVSSSPSAEAIITASTSMSTEFESGNQALRAHETPFSELSQSGHVNSHSEERRPRGQVNRLFKPRPKATKGVAGWRAGRNSRITKRSWRSAMGLRSRKLTEFNE